MSLAFRKVVATSAVAAYLADVIGEKLRSDKQVVWLVSGGSAVAVAAEASKLLRDMPLGNLTVTLTDERYGQVGHADSNWAQLQAAGFDLPGAALLPVLHGDGLDATVQKFAAALEQALNKADYRIGLFGIGADGHTAGILPHSSAANATDVAHGYDGGNFIRITMARPAIAKLDEAVVYAVGEEKWPVVDQLETDIAVEEQPAQALKQVPKVIVYNDHKGEFV